MWLTWYYLHNIFWQDGVFRWLCLCTHSWLFLKQPWTNANCTRHWKHCLKAVASTTALALNTHRHEYSSFDTMWELTWISLCIKPSTSHCIFVCGCSTKTKSKEIIEQVPIQVSILKYFLLFSEYSLFNLFWNYTVKSTLSEYLRYFHWYFTSCIMMIMKWSAVNTNHLANDLFFLCRAIE